MKDGKRHGWGAELPIIGQDAHDNSRVRYYGQWKLNKRVINEGDDNDDGKLYRDKQRERHTSSLN
jgi:hypothetical protein